MTVSGYEQSGGSVPEVSDHRDNYRVDPVTIGGSSGNVGIRYQHS